ncbi:SDR family NAD(P)-dependent oxidoreductase [Robbsia andropogonis]|uniref:SDR family NAD(P)-dependent oxidoreductase n=1 Tax=Robbsia andropogonis TaxID=28092 RepID=UPI0020A0C373|nr:SDR family NAD(P)-dependent oxidoreductase [Robbsia andropogonis]MCP1118453.1 SDR family NAD(P)-dependent oxidoreductase [Robbsia andropogonis]MCP1127767.1 SDR family NAD(P)-dependent oxidoreductase [Robbsia andropogonis]
MIATRLLRRPRVVIVGFGDVATRTIPLLTPRYRIVAMRRHAAPIAPVARRGTGPGDAATPSEGASPRHMPLPALASSTAHDALTRVSYVAGDLDARRSLRRAAALAASAFGVLYFAPPAPDGEADARTARWITAVASVVAARRAQGPHRRRFGGIVPDTPAAAAYRRGDRTLRAVYASTSGVYGDCGGALVPETRVVSPSNARAVRRVDAERKWRETSGLRRISNGASLRHRVAILRIPGIYAADRLPEGRLRDRMPALRESDDVYTNHIHADDLATIAVRALTHGRPQRLYHASDDSRLRMGDYFDKVADALRLPRAPRLPRDEAVKALSPTMWSFMRESRQLDNRRLHRELGVRLRYPDVDALLVTLAART